MISCWETLSSSAMFPSLSMLLWTCQAMLWLKTWVGALNMPVRWKKYLSRTFDLFCLKIIYPLDQFYNKIVTFQAGEFRSYTDNLSCWPPSCSSVAKTQTFASAFISILCCYTSYGLVLSVTMINQLLFIDGLNETLLSSSDWLNFTGYVDR